MNVERRIAETNDRIEHLKSKLHDELAGTIDAFRLSDLSNQLAHQQGCLHTYRQFLKILGSREDQTKAVILIAAAVTHFGADDTWSGRGNDAKRSHHDGRLEALGYLLTQAAE
jgi:hypothetical protein